jgi:hypothetical protein
MFLCGTNKHSKGQKNHLRQNSLRLQTPHKRKITRQAHGGGATGWTTPAMSQLPLRTSQHSKSSSTSLSPRKMRP